MRRIYIVIIVLSALTAILLNGCSEDIRMVTGSYSKTGEGGINVFDFNPGNGNLKHVSSFNAGTDPSYFCFSKKYKMIYVINEVSDFMNAKGGGLTTIQYDGNFNNLRKTGEMAVPNGGPCYISISPDNDFLLIANYGGGSVAVIRLDSLGIPISVTDSILFNGDGGKSSHAHMISFDPRGERVYLTDLGLDRIMIYSLDKTTGKLVEFSKNGIKVPEGTGPRHFVFNSAGTQLYLMGELNSTITVFETDKKEGLKHLQTISSLRGGTDLKNASADIHIGKTGDFLYASNRGENTIAIFRIKSNGQLMPAGYADCGGNWPRNFVVDPSGKYLLVGNQKSGDIAVFKIDRFTGLPAGPISNSKLESVSCLKF
jgi:6-phosphogluconolactonase